MPIKKLVDDNLQIIEENTKDKFYVNLNNLMTSFTKQNFEIYDHQENYELFWFQKYLCADVSFVLSFFCIVVISKWNNQLFLILELSNFCMGAVHYLIMKPVN